MELATGLRFRTCVLTVVGVLIGSADRVSAADSTPEGIAFFEKRIRPLLVEHCYSCHSTSAKKSKGGLRVDTRQALREGGSLGAAIVPGKPADSWLLKAVRYDNDDLRMPPKKKLSASAIRDLEAWVAMGAPDPRGDTPSTAQRLDLVHARDFWSFRPIQTPALPKVNDPAWSSSDIDRFVRAKLDTLKLRPAPLAERRTLIRRATYDLTGLPPTPQEIDAFLADRSPQAFHRVIDRLLASPAYGERWGRHWLDLVRYADTAGDNSDYPIPQMYKYRNWVIAAFNADMPYDRFVREQLAGDLMPSDGTEDRQNKLIATGYLANAHRFGSYEDKRYPWHLTIEDTIDNLGRTFLGLTINCCRCHDHKFDPLSNEDYYALYGFFQSTRYPWPGIELDQKQHDLVPLASPQQVEAAEKERKQQRAKLDARIKQCERDKADAERGVREAEKIKDEKQRRAKIAAAKQRDKDAKNKLDVARKERENLSRQPLPFEMVYAVVDQGSQGKKKVGNACIQIKGDPERLGKEVPRRFPSVLGGQPLPANVQGSGRLELARWITDSANPLTARVIVNRIWQYHFGTGIVATPSDFGKQGRPPSHPELLDYLAHRFIAGGWSIKAMHRLIMTSRTYQMASGEDADNARRDVGNTYLWRYPRQRLDAESIRDTLLAVSGNLERGLGGPHPFPPPHTWHFTQHNPFKAVYDSRRRSVYLMAQRIQRHPFLGLFDGADTNSSTPTRTTSTTPLQALYLLNDRFVHQQAEQFAARLRSARPDDAGRIEQAFVMLYGRPPRGEEQSQARNYLQQAQAKLQTLRVPAEQRSAKAWESFVRALFLSNELVYVN